MLRSARNDDADETAIVTGAGKRVGADDRPRAARRRLDVVAHVHHEDDGCRKARPRSSPTSPTRIAQSAYSPAREACRRCGLLVNNAARFAWDGFGEFSADEFEAHMAVNVARAGAADRPARARSTDGGDALVVNLLDSKLAAPNPDYLSYTLSKQALAGLTELAARALAPRGIRVNGIAPGADAAVERAERGEFRRRCMPPIRSGAASSRPT